MRMLKVVTPAGVSENGKDLNVKQVRGSFLFHNKRMM